MKKLNQLASFSTHHSPFTTFFRGRLIGRTVGSEPADRGSNPLPEANSIWILDFGFWIRRMRRLRSVICNPKSKIDSRAFHRWPYGLALGASVRRFESCCPDQSDFGFGIWVCRHGKSQIPNPKSM